MVDARELMVAEGPAMDGGEPVLLRGVVRLIVSELVLGSMLDMIRLDVEHNAQKDTSREKKST